MSFNIRYWVMLIVSTCVVFDLIYLKTVKLSRITAIVVRIHKCVLVYILGSAKCDWLMSPTKWICMIVLVKNLYTVYILIWLTQMRNSRNLRWRGIARLDTARRSTPRHNCLMLWRRAALRNHSLLMPECAFWAGPLPQTTPPHTHTHTPYIY